MYVGNKDGFHCTKVCLYRGLQATAKITYKTILQDNLVRFLLVFWLPLVALS